MASLTAPTATRLIGVACFLLAILAAIPIPLFHMAPAAAILLFGLALIYRDGVVVIVAAIAAVVSLAVNALLVGSGVAALNYLAGVLAQSLAADSPVGLSARFIDGSPLLVIWAPSVILFARSKGVFMRIRQFSAALALGVAALGLSACASSSTPLFLATRRCLLRRARPSSSCPPAAWQTTAAWSSSAMPAIVAQQLQARGFQPATERASANMIVQFGYGVDRGQVRYVEDPFYYSRWGYGGWGSPFYSPFYRSRCGWGGGYGLGLERPLLVRRRHRLLCRISQPDRPPHPRQREPTRRCSTAAPRRAR